MRNSQINRLFALWPIYPHFRRLLLVGLAAARRASVAAEVAADPIFALIEAHRATHAAHLAAIREADRLAGVYCVAYSYLTEEPCHDEIDAFEAMVAARATTWPGFVGKLAYIQALSADRETDWMIEDRGCAAVLIDSFAASLKNFGVLS